MPNNRIVLDTNCLLACISSKSENFPIWKGFQEGKFILCVSNEILEEYQEIIARKASPIVAENVVNAIVESEFVEFVDPQFHLNLIAADHDDDKFVDCAFAANAIFIVSDDTHFDVLKNIPFPQLLVIKLREFLNLLLQPGWSGG
ncbi:MAG: putative toxin-antitoxin system toxin component, PIN family [Bacteroidaceae bacterium]|nr:putative toxin-antitoxin system toxin component, PIN family [Bacteroidaceae bacterium]MBP3259796.1 putative toxin-antitoxin system toxin component, PIN family [Prevotella sp.]